jgi:exodeoxyribonuclease-3
MRVITINLNGIRSAARAGFFHWLKGQDADVVCMQETRAHAQQLSDPLFYPLGYHHYFFDAEKKGYSGVALYSKVQPKHVHLGLGHPGFDQEGRYLRAQFAHLNIISVYMPSGTSGEHRQTMKYQFMDFFLDHLRDLMESGQHHIICGDWNIAHKQIDIKNWRANQKHSGFLPEERAWLSRIIDEVGYRDAFRLLNQEAEQYTWWSNRGQAYAKNVGWRIDYQFITPALSDKVKAVTIYKGQRFSDHAPLIIDYDYILL